MYAALQKEDDMEQQRKFRVGLIRVLTSGDQNFIDMHVFASEYLYFTILRPGM